MTPITNIDFDISIGTGVGFVPGGFIFKNLADGAIAEGELLYKAVPNTGFQLVGNSIYVFSGNSVALIIPYQHIVEIMGVPYTPISVRETMTDLLATF
jgi:hypothetical protein